MFNLHLACFLTIHAAIRALPSLYPLRILIYPNFSTGLKIYIAQPDEKPLYQYTKEQRTIWISNLIRAIIHPTFIVSLHLPSHTPCLFFSSTCFDLFTYPPMRAPDSDPIGLSYLKFFSRFCDNTSIFTMRTPPLEPEIHVGERCFVHKYSCECPCALLAGVSTLSWERPITIRIYAVPKTLLQNCP